MSKLRSIIFILGSILICAISSVVTFFGLSSAGAIVTDPIDLVFTLEDLTKKYDGQPLVPDSYELEGELINGHKIQVTYDGSQTSVGQSESDINVKVIDEDNKDVTRQYDIIVNKGTLTVDKAPLDISLDDCEVTYNGNELIPDDFIINSGSLVDGHKVVTSVSSGLLNVDDILSEDIEPIIYDAFGNNVTENYDIDFSIGDISIKKRPLAIRLVGGSKIYDGTPLGVSSYEIVGGALVEGQIIVIDEYQILDGQWTNQNGSEGRIDVGVTKVTVDKNKVKIRQWDEEVGDWDYVQGNYEIQVESCVVEVLKKDLTIATKSIKKEYDSEPATMAYEYLYATGLVEGDEIESFEYVDCEVNELPSLTDVGVKDVSIDPKSVEMKDGKEINYNISVIPGTIEIRKAYKDIIIKKQDNEVYTGDFYNFTLEELISGYDELSEDIKNAISAPENVYKNAGTYNLYVNVNNCKNYELNVITNTFTIEKKSVVVSIKENLDPIDEEEVIDLKLEDVIKEQNLDKEVLDALSLTKLPLSDRKYQLNINVGNVPNYNVTVNNGTIDIIGNVSIRVVLEDIEKTYDGDAYQANLVDIVKSWYIDGLKAEYKNIPQEVIEELELKSTDAYVNAGSYSLEGKPVEIDGYDVIIESSRLTILPQEVIVEVFVPEKLQNLVYDGINHTYSVKDVVDNYSELPAEVRSALSVPSNQDHTNAKVGNDRNYYIDVQCEQIDNYDIKINKIDKGTFIISPRDLFIEIQDVKIEYTGNVYEYPTDKFKANLVGNDKISIFVNIEGNQAVKDAGLYTVFVSNVVFDSGLETNYNVDLRDSHASITINPKPIDVIVKDYVTTYDPARPVSLKGVDIIANYNSLDSSIKSEIDNFTNSIPSYTSAGKYIIDVYEELNSKNYGNYIVKLSDDSATVTIEKRQIEIELKELASKEYDGVTTSFTLSQLINENDYVKEILDVLSVPNYSYVDAGTYQVTLNYKNTTNYIISVIPTYFEITQKNVEVKFAKSSYNKSYDGKPFALTASDLTVESLLMGHKVVDIIHNEIIDATSDLIIDYITIFDGNNIDVTKNYSIALPENNCRVNIDSIPVYLEFTPLTINYDFDTMGGDLISYLDNPEFESVILSHIKISSSSPLLPGHHLVTEDITYSIEPVYINGKISKDLVQIVIDDNISIVDGNYNFIDAYMCEESTHYISINKQVYNLKLKSFNTVYNSNNDFSQDIAHYDISELVLNYSSLPYEIQYELSNASIDFGGVLEMRDAGNYSYSLDFSNVDVDYVDFTTTGGDITISKKNVSVILRDYQYSYNGDNYFDYLDENAILCSEQEVVDALIISDEFDSDMIYSGVYYYTVRVDDLTIYNNYNISISIGKVVIA